MRVFVTGASGFIGSAVVPELLDAGHEVVGLARSDASAEALAKAGAQVRRGDLEDLDSLRAGAADSDGVIHLAFIHDFTQYPRAAEIDLLAIETIGAELKGSDRPFVIASGTLGVAPGRLATERDVPDATVSPRITAATTTLALAEQGVRSSVLRLAPSVHSELKTGFVGYLVDLARQKGVAGYVGDGANRWNAVHQLDAARLFRLALEKAPAGSVLHGVGEEGVPLREVAEVIGRRLGVPTGSIAPEDAIEHFAWMGTFIGLDAPASNQLTRELLGWEPTHLTLLEDLEQGHYFDTP
ncbi:SDR family oxidoreductase [Streptomyces sp. NPDC001982]|uniref:SDR family oxidoreductase n=1 Tax=Streptomyces sp. NPDC001982 TaxID=3154405 RepID=UPI00332A3E9D